MLGIKYESAVLAGLDEPRLAAIADQIREEAGDDWETEPAILHGRNAVREEQRLESSGKLQPVTDSKRNPSYGSFLGRWLKR